MALRSYQTNSGSLNPRALALVGGALNIIYPAEGIPVQRLSTGANARTWIVPLS